MKLFIDDILRIGWLKDVLEASDSAILKMKPDSYIVFYYDYDELNSSISVKKQEIRYIINEDIYRGLGRYSASKVGYFRPPFDTTNYLFYSYLKSCCFHSNRPDPHGDVKQLNNLYLQYKIKDKEIAKEKSISAIKGVFDIDSRMAATMALDEIFYVNKKPINGLMAVMDMFDGYFNRKNNVSFFNNVLKSFVRLIKNPNGGIINQENGFVRYLIIGEVVAGKDPDLFKAKEQLRQGIDKDTIYQNTGWYFNKFDSKWRKKIPDGYVQFKFEKVIWGQDYILSNSDTYSGGQSELYSDAYAFNQENIPFINLIRNGYNNRLGDVLRFDKAYELYPKLAEIFSLVAGGSDREFNDKYYYTSSFPESLILMRGTIHPDKLIFVALHEVQHYIQRIEGFGNGGNLYLANIINTVGGENAREFIMSINSFVKYIQENVPNFSDERLENIERRIQAMIEGETNDKVIDSLEKLISYVQSRELFEQYYSEFAYLLLNIYTFAQRKNLIRHLIQDQFDVKYIDLFESALKSSQLVLNRNRDLISKGWTQRDIWMLNFQTYEALVGETESRFVQNTNRMEEELGDYFGLYTSEVIDTKNVNVITESFLSEQPKNIAAAIEQANGYYIIHLPDEYSNSVNILHELGHIIYDILIDSQILNALDPEVESLAKSNNYTSSEEFICDSFVDYIHRKNIEEGLTEDLNESRSITNFDRFDMFFESILLNNQITIDFKGLEARLKFVKNILENL